MAFDPFAEDPRPGDGGHEIGQDLSLLSIDEIDERVEHAGAGDRPPEGSASRQATLPRCAASAFFKLGSA